MESDSVPRWLSRAKSGEDEREKTAILLGYAPQAAGRGSRVLTLDLR